MKFTAAKNHLSSGEALRVAQLDKNRTAHLRGSAQAQRSKQSAVEGIGKVKLDWSRK